MKLTTRLAAMALLALTGTGVAQTVPATIPTTTTRPRELLFTVSKETTAITSPLRADGAPDYRAALNEKYGKGVMAENNGRVLWLQLLGPQMRSEDARLNELKVCGAKETDLRGTVFVPFRLYLPRGLDAAVQTAADNDFVQAGRTLWVEGEYPLVVQYLQEQEKALGVALQAVNQPRWWTPRGENSYIPGIGYGLAAVQYLGHTWCARATLRAKAGDFKGFLEDAMAAKRLTRQLAGTTSRFGVVMGARIDNQASEAIAAAAGSGNLSAAQVHAIRAALDEQPALPDMVEAEDVWERWYMLNAVVELSQMRDGNSEKAALSMTNFDDRLKALDVTAVDWDVVMKSVNRQFDYVVAGLKQPRFADMQKAMAEIDERASAWREELAKREGEEANRNTGKVIYGQDTGESKTAYWARLARYLMARMWNEPGPLGPQEEERRRGRLTDQMTKLVLAVAEFKAKTGKWPRVLKDLVPAYLKEIPRDIYSGGEMFDVRFSVSEKGMWVYSVGRDAKDELGVGAR